MGYLDLIAERPLTWGLFIGYMVLTAGLAWMGHKKTSDIKDFAVGKGDMHPAIVGVTLSASIASTATFIINPGFVYVHGLSALMHLGVAVGLGLFAGLFLMSTRFRRIGVKGGAVTVPQWMEKRYESTAMGVTFALVNLLSLSFVVLIVGGLSIVMQNTLGLTNVESLVLIVVFVFSYIFIGGTYAHAYTNTLQGIIMVGVSLLILSSGIPLLDTDILGTISQVDPNLIALVNPESPLFNTPFTVFIAGFVIGFALVCQPHIMTKALYVKSDKDVWTYLGVTVIVYGIFTALLFVGLFARAKGMDPSAFVDPVTGVFRQDLVMTVYITEAFSPGVVAVITVALMAAGMSTLDGILVSLSSIAANDLFLNLTRNGALKGKSEDEQSRIAYRASQVILVAMGVVAFVIALNPPKLLGIFGQLGVYGLVAASTAPILFGILSPSLKKGPAMAAAGVGVTVHFILYGWGQWATNNGVDLVQVIEGWGPFGVIFDSGALQLGLRNPGVTAAYGLFASAVVAGVALLMERRGREGSAPAT